MARKTNIVTRESFENFVQAVSGDFHAANWRDSAHYRVKFALDENVTCLLHVYLLRQMPDGMYFEPNKSDHTHVRVTKEGYPDYNLFGKGARSSENWQLVRDLIDAI